VVVAEAAVEAELEQPEALQQLQPVRKQRVAAPLAVEDKSAAVKAQRLAPAVSAVELPPSLGFPFNHGLRPSITTTR
jgi:hypothetical protein